MRVTKTRYRDHIITVYDSGTAENWCFEVGGPTVRAQSDFEFKSREQAEDAAKLVIRCVRM